MQVMIPFQLIKEVSIFLSIITIFQLRMMGYVDIIRESNYITVSWNHFHNHDLTSLVGHDDNYTADRGKLKVTYHHNWFDGRTNVTQEYVLVKSMCITIILAILMVCMGSV